MLKLYDQLIMRKILFVCHGNICRSVMAEYILKSKSSDIYCESRATTNEEIGNDIYPLAKLCLDKNNIKYNKHHASRITIDDYKNFNEIYVMDSSNLREIRYIVDDVDSKIKKLCPYDIEDPWYTGNFDLVYSQILEGVNNLL